MFRPLARRQEYPFASRRSGAIITPLTHLERITRLGGPAPGRTRMRQRAQVGFGLLAILAAGMTLCAVWPPAMASSDSEHEDQGQSQIPLTAQEIRNLVDRSIENQRRNDALLDQ